jgi:hypothetical protein
MADVPAQDGHAVSGFRNEASEVSTVFSDSDIIVVTTVCGIREGSWSSLSPTDDGMAQAASEALSCGGKYPVCVECARAWNGRMVKGIKGMIDVPDDTAAVAARIQKGVEEDVWHTPKGCVKSLPGRR